MSPAPTPAPPRPLADFGDWLSPMIVKELRQGLRTLVFVGAFIVLQAVLVMTLLISASTGNAAEASELFWLVIAGILVFIVPLRGFNALAGEMKDDTLDLLVLTRLDTSRIAFGKWIALVAQSSLIAVSIMPYVVLRYFGGGVDLAVDLIGLLLAWMLSALVTAMAIAFSALPSVILRSIFMLGIGALTVATVAELSGFVLEGRTLSGIVEYYPPAPPPDIAVLAVLTPLWAFACWFFLEFGASAIAPLAANHATRKRLVVLALMLGGFLVSCWLPRTHPGRETVAVGQLILTALVALDCLTESPTTVPSVYLPFVRRGRLGRLAAYFLAPGWATGVLFYALSVAVLIASFSLLEDFKENEFPIILGTTLLTPITVLALALLCFRRATRLLTPFLVSCLALAAFTFFIVFMLEEVVDYASDASALIALLGGLTPLTSVIVSTEYQYSLGIFRDLLGPVFLRGGFHVGLLYLALVVARALDEFKSMKTALNLAAQTIPPSSQS